MIGLSKEFAALIIKGQGVTAATQ